MIEKLREAANVGVDEVIEALIQARGALRLDAMVDESGKFYPTTTVALEHIDEVLNALIGDRMEAGETT